MPRNLMHVSGEMFQQFIILKRFAALTTNQPILLVFFKIDQIDHNTSSKMGNKRYKLIVNGV